MRSFFALALPGRVEKFPLLILSYFAFFFVLLEFPVSFISFDWVLRFLLRPDDEHRQAWWISMAPHAPLLLAFSMFDSRARLVLDVSAPLLVVILVVAVTRCNCRQALVALQ